MILSGLDKGSQSICDLKYLYLLKINLRKSRAKYFVKSLVIKN